MFGRRFRFAALLAAGLCFGTASAWAGEAGYEAGVLAYQRGAYQEALREFRALAGHGVAAAEFMLGAMYYYGKGVEPSSALAAVWFERAASKGDANAQLAFGSLHINGVGVRRDLVTAHMWLSIAARSEVSELHDRAVRLRDDTAEMMTPREMRESERRLRNWRPREAGFSRLERKHGESDATSAESAD